MEQGWRLTCQSRLARPPLGTTWKRKAESHSAVQWKSDRARQLALAGVRKCSNSWLLGWLVCVQSSCQTATSSHCKPTERLEVATRCTAAAPPPPPEQRGEEGGEEDDDDGEKLEFKLRLPENADSNLAALAAGRSATD